MSADALRDGSRVKITLVGQAHRDVEPYDTFVASSRNTSFEAIINSEPDDGPDFPDLDTIRGIWRAMYHVQKDVLTQIEKLGTEASPIHVCVSKDCVREIVLAAKAAETGLPSPPVPSKDADIASLITCLEELIKTLKAKCSLPPDSSCVSN
jgi:hypothetical protein